MLNSVYHYSKAFDFFFYFTFSNVCLGHILWHFYCFPLLEGLTEALQLEHVHVRKTVP